jgi:hypothetical protein
MFLRLRQEIPTSRKTGETWGTQVNTNFKSSGQECPHHTNNRNMGGDGQSLA